MKRRPTAMQNAGTSVPVMKDLVLVGGGHSHVFVLKSFGMKPVPGLRVTLVARDVQTPYSGMLPGLVAGHYSYDECHIDLQPLARFAGARLLHCSAVGIDTQAKLVQLEGRPPLPYDILSINIGITPVQAAAGARQLSTAVKPIDAFFRRWQLLKERLLCSPHPMTVAVVGGGAGGVEILLAMQHGLGASPGRQGGGREQVRFRLHSRGGLLPSHNGAARAIFHRILRQRGVEVVEGEVTEVVDGTIKTIDGSEYPFDECVWCTQGGAAKWLAASGLAVDSAGFPLVDDTLQSVNTPGVFAAGDVHSSAAYPRQKTGVIAVRQGLPLAENLRRAVFGQKLKSFVPQSKYLALISTGGKSAVASRGGFALEGGCLWRLKDWIDRGFMEKFSKLPEMALPPAEENAVARAAGPAAVAALTAGHMRCGGCGAKVGPDVLSRVLRRLEPSTRAEVLIGLDSPDDAAVVRLPPGTVGVHTVDFFRSFVDDVYTFGAVSANHALGDCFAMGARPISALAIASVPPGIESKVEEDLYQMMAGALSVLAPAGCALVGGHSSEAQELSLGFAVNGAAQEDQLLRKGGMRPGDVLVLTKAIGTGVIFAANMRRKAKGRWVAAALESMLLSNQRAAEILRAHGATACTDVTGFGVLGHLAEMGRASGTDVRMNLDAIAVLDGALEIATAGIFSSLHPSNLRLQRAVANQEQVAHLPRYALVFDPQTAGGLLASVPAPNVESCLRQLRTGGYGKAAAIGEVGARRTDNFIVTIESADVVTGDTLAVPIGRAQ